MRINLSTLAIGLAFFPFVSIYPIGTDVQPLFFIVALASILGARIRYNVTLADVFFLTLITLSLIYQYSFSEPVFSGFFRFSFSYIAFVFFSVFAHHINSRLIFILSLLHFSTLLTHLAMPTLFSKFAAIIVRTVKITEFGTRERVAFHLNRVSRELLLLVLSQPAF